jgi:quercetin dioxygenase-like cupin family protein
MGLRIFKAGDAKRFRAPVPGGPSAEVLIGTDDDWPMGVAHVVIPAGGGMPAHDHGSSAAMVLPLDNPVVLVDAGKGEEFEVGPGAVVTIPIGNLVEVHNRGGAEAAIAVVFNPPDFTRQLGGWPVDEDQ